MNKGNHNHMTTAISTLDQVIDQHFKLIDDAQLSTIFEILVRFYGSTNLYRAFSVDTFEKIWSTIRGNEHLMGFVETVTVDWSLYTAHGTQEIAEHIARSICCFDKGKGSVSDEGYLEVIDVDGLLNIYTNNVWLIVIFLIPQTNIYRNMVHARLKGFVRE